MPGVWQLSTAMRFSRQGKNEPDWPDPARIAYYPHQANTFCTAYGTLMATYLDMQKLAQNPGTVTMLANYLLRVETVEWTDWEVDFLESMATRTSTDPISTRQREVLVELKDNATSHTTTRDGLSVRTLILRCWEARLDLDEEDEQFVVQLYESKVTSLKSRQLGRLQRCVHGLNIYG
jgi:hypothetical protein